tara:strand:- start:2430 stop:3110 length:681 start_codon:yes stop_codon:yes gene_type:complete
MSEEIFKMDEDSENVYSIVCDKGDMLLESTLINNNKAFRLNFILNNIDPVKINLKNLLSHNIYELIEKFNPDLIEKIHILNIYNEDEADIMMLFKHIAKEIGIKKKYILFNTTRTIDFNNNVIEFKNEDISLKNKELNDNYISKLNLNNYEPLIYKQGHIHIKLENCNLNLINLANEQTFNDKINTRFTTDFQILTTDDLPLYMENIVGLMIKKVFYNLKQFIDKL